MFDPLELKLQMAVNFHVDAMNQTPWQHSEPISLVHSELDSGMLVVHSPSRTCLLFPQTHAKV